MIFTSYLVNKITDWIRRGQAYTPATAAYSLGLLTSTRGPRANSTVYAANDTLSLTANDGKTHLYKCTTAGTSAAAQSTLYPGALGEAITDGTAVFTEQTAVLRAGTAVEASYTGYARSNTAASMANWSGTQGAGTTVASTGTGVPNSSNNVAVTFGTTPTSGPALAWAVATFDATSGGNMLEVLPLSVVKTVNNGDPAPNFPAGTLTFYIDN
jgi:hypothetical protein